MSLARLFVVAATSPASRKFHGTKRSARCSRRVWISLLSCSVASTRLTMERSLVEAGSAPTRMTISPSSTAVPAKTSSPAMRSTASGFAGERRLIDHGLPAHHHAVDAHGHTGARHDEVARAEALGGHGDLLAVLEATRALGDGHERADELVLGARAGGVLESLAQIEQEHGALPRSLGRAWQTRGRWPRRRAPARRDARA